MSKKFQPLDYSRGWDDYWRDHPQGYSPQEQMVNWSGQLNAMIDFFNQYFDVDLAEYATDVMEGWYFDGRLDDIINEALFDSKADKTTLAQITVLSSQFVSIQEAINSGAEHILIQGDNVISEKITVDRPVTLEFREGSKISCSVGYSDNEMIEITSSDVALINPILDGSNLPIETTLYVGTTTPKGIGIRIAGLNGLNLIENVIISGGNIENTTFPAIWLNYTKNSIIENVTAVNCSSNVTAASPATLYSASSLNTVVRSCRIVNSGLKGINISSGEYGVIDGNYIEHTNVGHSALFSSNNPYIKIINNTVIGGHGCKVDRGLNAIVANNTFKECVAGIMLQAGKYIVVHGNTIFSSGSCEGISASGHPTYSQPIENCIISNNMITIGAPTSATDGIQLYSSTEYRHAKNISILGNIIKGGQIGIYLRTGEGFDYDNIKIENNTVMNTNYDAIHINGKNITVKNNNIANVVDGNGVILNGAGEVDSKAYAKIVGNEFDGCSRYGIYIVVVANHKNLIIDGNTFKNVVKYNVAIAAATVKNISFKDNVATDSTTSHLLSMQGDGTTQNIILRGNIAPGLQIAFTDAANMIGFADANICTLTSKPAGVLTPLYELPEHTHG